MTLKSLPPDIILDILSRLPTESVLDCKLVCKRLLSLLTSRRNQFAEMHHRRQLLQLANGEFGNAAASSSVVKMGLMFSILLDEEKDSVGPRLYYGDKYNDEMNIHDSFSYKTLKKTSISYPLIKTGIPKNVIVGSLNGLICLNRYHDGILDPIYICNPMTGEYVKLPKHTLSPQNYIGAFGFGYIHSITTVYKVVRIYYEKFEDYAVGEVQVYTIGSGSGWRTIGRTSYYLCFPQHVGIFANGALNWLENKNIVAFSLADEEFRLVQQVPCLNHNLRNCTYGLQALGGNLCLCLQNISEHLLEIWSLKGTGPQESWSREFSIDLANMFPCVPLLLTKKNEVLLVHEGATLYCYEPENNYLDKILG
ncbi:F-box protein At3g07870-like [Papaver somniferum]|uniref:F-box protein At3g07870-like n=1 Tax=Papaver somniferum TaxID=3469 RepID=UPI000E702562|nr:F-box protein At3g07870-like [Papaver somniferum]